MPLSINPVNPELSVSLPLRLPTGPCYGPDGLNFLDANPRTQFDAMTTANCSFAFYDVVAAAFEHTKGCSPIVAAIMQGPLPSNIDNTRAGIVRWVAYKFLAVRGCREWRARSGSAAGAAALKVLWDSYRFAALDIYNDAPLAAALCDQACALLG